jgi:hypothetical protein
LIDEKLLDIFGEKIIIFGGEIITIIELIIKLIKIETLH